MIGFSHESLASFNRFDVLLDDLDTVPVSAPQRSGPRKQLQFLPLDDVQGSVSSAAMGLGLAVRSEFPVSSRGSDCVTPRTQCRVPTGLWEEASRCSLRVPPGPSVRGGACSLFLLTEFSDFYTQALGDLFFFLSVWNEVVR